MRRLLILTVRAYQLAISPWLGNHCRFYPNCSQYAIEAIEGHGVIKGCWLTLKRLARCHPLCDGGEDPVPPVKQQKLTVNK